MTVRGEILTLLAQQGEAAPVDFPAIYILLNTVAGGHYEERFAHTDIEAALVELCAEGAVAPQEGEAGAIYRITPSGRALLSGERKGSQR